MQQIGHFSIKEMITFIIPSFYGFGGNTYWGTIEPAMTDFPNYLGLFTIIFAVYALKKKNKDEFFNYFLMLAFYFLLYLLVKIFSYMNIYIDICHFLISLECP